jgi:hypothetical protein
MPNAWNPRLVIKGGRWIFYLYCCQILTLESNRKDTNRWFKVVIMNCQILTVKGCLSWPLWASIAAAVMSINQKEPSGYGQMSGHPAFYYSKQHCFRLFRVLI